MNLSDVPTPELNRLGHALQDSVVVESPLPGGVATLVRFLLQSVPQWIQMGGVLFAAVAAIGVGVLLWRHRSQIFASFSSRSAKVKVALGVGVSLLLIAAATAGAVSWDYMQHDNGFCTGCHIMDTAFFRFEESEHDSLSCHDCHQQSIFASSRQLYLWVAERPAEIGEHAPVPNAICENCHVTGEPEIWQRIASTAGHRTHLESDSITVMCVTCHGQEVHRFAPVDQTCGQSGCHASTVTDITIGAMRQQTALHCVTCHEFVVDVPALATRDSAAAVLVPGFERCTSCHEMQAVLTDFDPEFDPHSGTCGDCHKPHEQTVAEDAAATCTTSGCHDNWRREPFHTGTSHVDVANQCTLCHEPHRARVDASNCVGCHNSISARSDTPPNIRRRLQTVAPFDTNAALRRPIGMERPPNTAEPPVMHGPMNFGFWGGGMISEPLTHPPQLATQATSIALPDSFAHTQHDALSCLVCHTTQAGHGPLTFTAPRGCQICHHQDPLNVQCQQCHADAGLTQALGAALTISVENSPRRDRNVLFEHAQHTDMTCTTCHTTPVTLEPTEPVTTCTDCHTDHHAGQRNCVQCHDGATEASVRVHSPPVEAHRKCTQCHAAETVEQLIPDAQFCATCHSMHANHPTRTDRECTVCHFLETPERYRRHLVGSDGEP